MEYTCPEDAQRAVAELNEYEIRHKKYIGVVMSKDNCRLFVGKIPKDKSAEEIKEEMSYYTENVVHVIVHPSFRDNSKNRGFAFVEYASHRDAAMARRKLLPGKFRLFGSEVQVDWAEPEPEVDPVTMSKVTNLYVRNLHPDMDREDLLVELFSFPNRAFGQEPLLVVKAKKLNDFAFIHYATREHAETAMKLAQSDESFGQMFSSDGTRLYVTWAKPPGRPPNSRATGRYMNHFSNHSDSDHLSLRRPMIQRPDHHQIGNYLSDLRISGAGDYGCHAQNMQFRASGQQIGGLHQISNERNCFSRPMLDWSPQPQAGGDFRPGNQFSSIWTPGPNHSINPFTLPSPAASPVMHRNPFLRTSSPSLRTDSPFISSPNPFPTFARF